MASGRNGIGLVGVLTIVFVVLKLVGKITWPWLWVLSPLWIGGGITLAILALAAFWALGYRAVSRRR